MRVAATVDIRWNIKGKRGPKFKDNPGYRARHFRVASARGKACDYLCEGGCGSQAAEWATIHGRDGLDPGDYVALCRKCHREYDGHSAKIRECWVNRKKNESGKWVLSAA